MRICDLAIYEPFALGLRNASIDVASAIIGHPLSEQNAEQLFVRREARDGCARPRAFRCLCACSRGDGNGFALRSAMHDLVPHAEKKQLMHAEGLSDAGRLVQRLTSPGTTTGAYGLPQGLTLAEQHPEHILRPTALASHLHAALS